MRRRRPRPRPSRARRWLLVAGALLVAASLGVGLTARNTVQQRKAGNGRGAVTRYTITNRVYTLDLNDPRVIASVRFTLDGPAATVRSQVDRAPWTTCTLASGTTWTCPGGTLTTATDPSAQIVAVS